MGGGHYFREQRVLSLSEGGKPALAAHVVHGEVCAVKPEVAAHDASGAHARSEHIVLRRQVPLYKVGAWLEERRSQSGPSAGLWVGIAGRAPVGCHPVRIVEIVLGRVGQLELGSSFPELRIRATEFELWVRDESASRLGDAPFWSLGAPRPLK